MDNLLKSDKKVATNDESAKIIPFPTKKERDERNNLIMFPSSKNFPIENEKKLDNDEIIFMG